MKRFWISLSIFVVLILLSVTSTFYINKNNNKLLDMLSKIPTEYANSDTTSLNELTEHWKSISHNYSVFISHDKLLDIELLIDELNTVWEFNSPQIIKLKVSDIRSRLKLIEEELFPNIYNIL